MALKPPSLPRLLCKRVSSTQCLYAAQRTPRPQVLPSIRVRMEISHSLSTSARRSYRAHVRMPGMNSKRPRGTPAPLVDAASIARHRAKILRETYPLLFGLFSSMGAAYLVMYLWPVEEMKERRPPESGDAGPPPPDDGQRPSARPTGLQRTFGIAAEAPSEANETFRGKPVVVAPGGEKLLAEDPTTGDEIEVVPTGTSSVPHFPKTIYLPTTPSNTGTPGTAALPAGASQTTESEYTLIGLGIRTVSFLSIQVYVVGLYVQTSSLQALQSRLIKRVNPIASALIPGEKERLRQNLLDGDESFAIWDSLLRDTAAASPLDRGGVEMAVRVVPTRSTDFNHLRDGWVRGITARVQDAARAGSDEYADESFGAAKREFEALLGGRGKAPKGSVVVLTRAQDGRLGVLFQPKENEPMQDYGSVRDDRIARLVWLGYLGGKSVSSEGARRGVVDGCMELVGRPIGSLETKVA